MAALQVRAGSWRILFRYLGKQYAFTIGEVNETEARGTAAKVDYLLMRLKQNLIAIPPNCDIVTFVQHDGRPPEAQSARKEELTLAKIRDEYLALHAKVLDPRTVADMKGHWKHLARLIDDHFVAGMVTLGNLQKYVMDRIDEGVESATAKKEIITLRTCWNWAVRMSMLTGAFPNRGLRFPKGKEKPPFMTFAEAQRRIAAGEPDDLWESVFLTRPEIDEFLEGVKDRAQLSWVYPMLCFAAHTGARRSEMLRARVTDVDLAAATVLVREKKRRRDVEESTRRVPLSPFLKGVLQKWLAESPGGPFLFCHAAVVARSRKRSPSTGHKSDKTRASTKEGRTAGVKPREILAQSALTRNEAHDHFQRAIRGTKWENLTGYHALRHSFVSNCAASGVDQRLIDAWVGHTTEEMRRRYRHLIPSVEQEAIKRVFG